MSVLVSLLAVVALSAPLVASSAPQQFTQQQFPVSHNISGYLHTQGSYPDGDSSTWVINPTQCAWNDQDPIMGGGDGNTPADGVGVLSNCLIADWAAFAPTYPKRIALKVLAPKEGLQIALRNDAGYAWDVPPSVQEGNRRVWRLCVRDPVARAYTEEDLLIYPEIPGSNGGRGQLVNYTLEIRSPGRAA